MFACALETYLAWLSMTFNMSKWPNRNACCNGVLSIVRQSMADLLPGAASKARRGLNAAALYAYTQLYKAACWQSVRWACLTCYGRGVSSTSRV